MWINKVLIKAVAPVPKIIGHKSYLFVGPHADDIEIAAGGTVARLCAEGADVRYLICTDGRFGTEDVNLSPDALVEIRRKEQQSAAAKLGVKEVNFLSYHDGGNYNEDELRADIMKVIAGVQPDVVLCPDPKLYPECHPDHLKVGRACSAAYLLVPYCHVMKEIGLDVTAKPQVLAYFYTDNPNTYVKTSKYHKQVNEVLDSFPSQFPRAEDLKNLKLYLNVKTRINGLRSFKGRADSFRAMNNLHLHCCTEI